MPTPSTDPPAPGPPRSRFRSDVLSRLLPDLNRFLLAHPDIRQVFPRFSRKLQWVLAHQHTDVALYEQETGQFRIYAQHSLPGVLLPKDACFPLDKTPYGEVFRTRRPVLVEDLRAPQFACASTEELLRRGRRSGCWVPLQADNSILGALSISAGRPGAYREDDAFLLNEVAGQISLAVANQVTLQQLNGLKQRFDDQIHDWSCSFRDIAATAECGVVQWGTNGAITDANDAFLRIVERTRDDIRKGLNCKDMTLDEEYRGMRVQAETEFRDHGSFGPFRQKYARPDGTRVDVLVSTGLLNQRRPPWIALVVELGVGLAGAKTPLGTSRSLTPNCELIAAGNPAMCKILRDIEQVAPTDTTILLLGETGTGKEVVARTVYELSKRKHGPFVKVNCSAIPAELLESELFGHEKGAFTGAHSRKIGRLELAHGGTLFLDEVGDIPLALQPKLLRVLQEREFERLGGTQTIKIDVRVIAATNRNLADMVGTREFRSDLFYRLSVFPVQLPPLRERPESIPVLAHAFSQHATRRLNRPSLTISSDTMRALQRWPWPGNIRELENLIEHSVILSEGFELCLDLKDAPVRTPSLPSGGHTLREIERDHIARVLHDTNGIVGGKHGAASILGIARTTLQYKMRKLEIDRY